MADAYAYKQYTSQFDVDPYINKDSEEEEGNISNIRLYPEHDEIHLRKYKFRNGYSWMIVQKRWYWGPDCLRSRIYKFKAVELGLPHNRFDRWQDAEKRMKQFFDKRYLGYWDGETMVWKEGKDWEKLGKDVQFIPNN